MTNKHGDFVWYELMTRDSDAAQNFYGGLLGWKFEEAGFNDQDYRAFSGSGGQVGGVLALTEEMTAGGARPAWLGYIRVDDVPGIATAIKHAGGAVLMESEVPGVGPFAFVADPQGAMFYVIDDQSGDASNAFAATEPEEMLIDEVEALWAAIAERDDWAPFEAKLARLEQARQAWGLALT